jgi:hypothetical protein
LKLVVRETVCEIEKKSMRCGTEKGKEEEEEHANNGKRERKAKEIENGKVLRSQLKADSKRDMNRLERW